VVEDLRRHYRSFAKQPQRWFTMVESGVYFPRRRRRAQWKSIHQHMME